MGSDGLRLHKIKIDALVAQLRASFPNKPVSPVLHYISAHSMEMYKNKLSLSGRTGEGVDLIIVEDTPYLLIDHNEWKNAVAYETYDSTNTLIHVTITGTATCPTRLPPYFMPTKAIRFMP